MAKKPPLYPHVPKGQVETTLPAFIEGAPPKYLMFRGRQMPMSRHKLVGLEKSESTAEIWAANMREHSGENITVIPTSEGYALYREED